MAEPSVTLEPTFARLCADLPHGGSFASSLLGFDQWREETRRLVAARLGLAHEAPTLLESWEGPLERVTVHGTELLLGRVLLRTEEDLWVPALLCLPPNLEGPAPAMVCCQGHATEGMRLSVGMVDDAAWQDLVANGDRDLALQAVRRGHVALALEMRAFGELRLPADRESNANNSCTRLSLLALEAGRTLLGMRVHDIRCAVSYLAARPEVDGRRIALTGNSGGGTVTVYGAALEERIAAAIPSCAFCTYAASIQAVEHCACNFVPGLAHDLEMQDVAGLVAPRPQLVIAGREDSIFPLHGVEEAYGALAAIYEAAGHPERLHLYVGPGGHRYYAAPVEGFLARALAEA